MCDGGGLRVGTASAHPTRMMKPLAMTIAAFALFAGQRAQATGATPAQPSAQATAAKRTKAPNPNRQSGKIATVYRDKQTGVVTSLQARGKGGRMGPSQVVLSPAESQGYLRLEARAKALRKQADAKQKKEQRFLAAAAKTGGLSPEALVILVGSEQISPESVLSSPLSPVSYTHLTLPTILRV